MRAAIYARVSTEGQEKQDTIASQIKALHDYAEQQNLQILEEYIDNGYSGELLDRPALDRLRDDARKKLFDAVVIYDPDRLSRKFYYTVLIQEELKRLNIAIIYLSRPDAKDTPQEILLSNMRGVIAEYEKAMILERTRRGRIHKAKSGHVIGNVPPYGYRYLNGGYQIDPTEAGIVRLIFNLFTQERLKFRTIVRELASRGIPPRRGKYWGTCVIHNILSNETYIGTTYYHKSKSIEIKGPKRYKRTKNDRAVPRPKEEWIPINLPKECIIIDEETFNNAQELLKRNLTDFNRGNTKRFYLLKGLIKCGKCGYAFCGGKGGGRTYYRCSNETPRCGMKWINTKKIEPLIWDKLCEIIQQPDLMFIAQKMNDYNESDISINETIASIENKLRGVEKETERILDVYQDGSISKDTFRDRMSKIGQKKDHLETELKKFTAIRERTILDGEIKGSIIEYCKVISENLLGISEDFDAKRHLLTLLIDKIEMYGDHIKIYTAIPHPSITVSFMGS